MSWDVNLFRTLNAELTHPWLDAVMPVLTSSSSYRVPGVVLILWILVRGTPRQRWILLGLGLCVALSDQFSSKLLKPLFDRPRPGWTLEDVRLLLSPKHSASFPSSHAVNLTAAGWFLYRCGVARWLSVGMLAAVLVISYSRIYVGVHYPSDVLGGMLIGLLVAQIWARIWPWTRPPLEPESGSPASAAQNPSSAEGDRPCAPQPSSSALSSSASG